MPETPGPQNPDSRPPEPGSAGTTRSGRQRLTYALRRPTRGQLVVGVLLAIVGFAAMTQVRANEGEDAYAGYREQELIDVLNGLAGTSQRAQAEITRLENTREELLSSTSARQAALEQAREDAETLEILAGTVPVTGPGIRITIEEVDGPVDIDSLLDTIQALRAGGGEAMQFNGEVRVVAQTSFEDGVGGISVDGTQLSPPYVIDVIGEPGTLAGSLTFPLGPVAQLEGDGGEVDVDELQSIDIESVVPRSQADFAEPVPSQ